MTDTPITPTKFSSAEIEDMKQEWQWVPKERTERMGEASRTYHGQPYVTHMQWERMLAAAPSPPATHLDHATIERCATSQDEDARDAGRWRALMSSQRLHFMGSAGFNKESPRAGEVWHFGMEFWSTHDAYNDPKYPDKFERKLLTNYADKMAAIRRHVAGEGK